MHPDNQHLLIITTIKDSDVSAIGQTFHTAPEIIVIKILSRGRFERVDLAGLRIHSRHHVLDGPIFAGCIHRLKDQEHSPLVLGVELVLQFGQGQDSGGQRLLRSWLVFLLGELKRVVRIDILQAKVLPFGDAKRFGNASSGFDDFFCFHKFTCRWCFAIL